MTTEAGNILRSPTGLSGCISQGQGICFPAVLVGELLAGSPLRPAVKRAMDVLEKLIFLEQDEIEKNKGIRIEKFLSVLKE